MNERNGETKCFIRLCLTLTTLLKLHFNTITYNNFLTAICDQLMTSYAPQVTIERLTTFCEASVRRPNDGRVDRWMIDVKMVDGNRDRPGWIFNVDSSGCRTFDIPLWFGAGHLYKVKVVGLKRSQKIDKRSNSIDSFLNISEALKEFKAGTTDACMLSVLIARDLTHG